MYDALTNSLLLPYVYKVIGMSLSWTISSELKRTRLHDRIRLVVLGWFRPVLSSSGNGPDPPMSRTTFNVVKYTTPQENATSQGTQSDNSVSTILSPSTSLTSSLWVSTLRIPPQHRLQQQKANGMEFFYVLQGKGELKVNTGDNDSPGKTIAQGDAFIVEANRYVARSRA